MRGNVTTVVYVRSVRDSNGQCTYVIVYNTVFSSIITVACTKALWEEYPENWIYTPQILNS